MMRAVVLGLVVAAAPAWAEPAYVARATWLRGAPAAEGRVLDELQDGQRVERMECGAGWCRVMAGRAGGYVAEALLMARPPAQLMAGAGECFPAQHLTPAGPVALRICPAEMAVAGVRR